MNFAFENYFILKKYYQNEDSDNYPFHAYFDKESLHIDTDDGVSIINQVNSTHISSNDSHESWFINWIKQITQNKYLLSQNLCTIENKLFQFNFLREDNGDYHIFYGEPLNMHLSVILGYEAMTSREYEIFNHIIDGKKNSDIANVLNISQNTVSFHLKNIFKKYDVHTRLELLAKLNISG